MGVQIYVLSHCLLQFKSFFVLCFLSLDIAYPGSNSSGESDAVGGASYRDKGGDKPRLSDIPAHVNESISISDMDRDATDIEVSVYMHTLFP